MGVGARGPTCRKSAGLATENLAAGAIFFIAPAARCSNAGLPTGRYGITIVTAAGQTWSLPNDLAPLAIAPAAPTAAPTQGVFLRIDRTPLAEGYVCPPTP